MPTMTTRGYLLLEAAVGGAMVAVIIGSLLTSMSQARTMSVLSGRDQTASQLVGEKLEERRALGFDNVTPEAAAVVIGVTGEYKRTTTVTDCIEVLPPPGTDMPCKDIAVTVTYQVSANAGSGAAGVRTSQATARVYQQ